MVCPWSVREWHGSDGLSHHEAYPPTTRVVLYASPWTDLQKKDKADCYAATSQSPSCSLVQDAKPTSGVALRLASAGLSGDWLCLGG